jgi:hypothetical protein
VIALPVSRAYRASQQAMDQLLNSLPDVLDGRYQ